MTWYLRRAAFLLVERATFCGYRSASGIEVKNRDQAPRDPLDHNPAGAINVMFSPFSSSRPNGDRSPFAFFFVSFSKTSSASSMTMFINSSNPMIVPSITESKLSYSHMVTLVFCCKCLKMTLMGCTITFLDDMMATFSIRGRRTQDVKGGIYGWRDRVRLKNVVGPVPLS